MNEGQPVVPEQTASQHGLIRAVRHKQHLPESWGNPIREMLSEPWLQPILKKNKHRKVFYKYWCIDINNKTDSFYFSICWNLLLLQWLQTEGLDAAAGRDTDRKQLHRFSLSLNRPPPWRISSRWGALPLRPESLKTLLGGWPGWTRNRGAVSRVEGGVREGGRWGGEEARGCLCVLVCDAEWNWIYDKTKSMNWFVLIVVEIKLVYFMSSSHDDLVMRGGKGQSSC